MYRHGSSFTLIFSLLLLACNGCYESKDLNYDQNSIKEQLEQANIQNLKREKKEIDRYVKKNRLDVVSTGTGLQYYIYENGQGKTGKTNQEVTLHYSIYLLNDTLLYSSLQKEPARFRIGKATVETGLHEAAQLLRVGDKAKLFLPSHLAHGAFGDQKKIPPQTPLLYDVHLLDLK